MNTDTFSVRLNHKAKARLQKLAKTTGRSRSFLAAEAIVAYLDTNEWQVAGINKALTSLDRGKGIA
jgi:predicted transcriptional regulator